MAYLYSLNLTCFRFCLAFSFARARCCIVFPLPLFHRVWKEARGATAAGAKNLGMVEGTVGLAAAKLSLANEAMHWFTVAMVIPTRAMWFLSVSRMSV